MKRIILLLLCLIPCSSYGANDPGTNSEQVSSEYISEIPKEILASAQTTSAPSKYRGWDYVVAKLREDGVPEPKLRAVYLSRRMPAKGFVPFAVEPKELPALYSNFFTPTQLKLGDDFLRENRFYFKEAERAFKVNRYVIAAILLIESHYGRVTGTELVVNRLSRIASVGAPQNLILNFEDQKKKDPTVTFEKIISRARYLEATFYPELKALFEVAQHRGISILEIRGSVAGAFGMPQFLPTSYLRFGIDANRDKVVSLFTPPDAIASTARFLNESGWDDGANDTTKRASIFKYNKSDAYVDAVMRVKELLESNQLK